jgi:hypothetical protein
VRQVLNDGRVDRQERIEEVSEPDALRLRYQPESRTISIEAPWAAALDYLQT